MVIAIDFDGTVVDHRYPSIGEEAPGAIETLKALVEAGHRLVLFTMRSGRPLSEAVEWLQDHGVQLWGVQYNPEQVRWAASNKAYAHCYIDDAAFGCPVIHPEGFARPCVDWSVVREVFKINLPSKPENEV